MTTEPAVAPRAVRCEECGTEWGPRVLACPGCRRLVHAGALEALAREAQIARDAGDAAAERDRWSHALSLLPAESKQAERIRARMGELDAIAPGPSPSAKSGAVPKWVAGLGAGGLLLWKAKAILLFVATKAKLLLTGLASWQSAFSIVISFGVYWVAWGWPFALGLIASVYVHELGHVVALRHYGIRASAPMFIPGIGAFVRLDQRPPTPVHDSRVGLAGPWAGLAAALIAYALHAATGAGIFAAIVQLGAFINLFNLIPVWQLDGSRGFASLTRAQRSLAAFVIGAAMLVSGQWLLVVPLVAAAARALFGAAPIQGDRSGLVQYVSLIAALTALASIDVPTP